MSKKKSVVESVKEIAIPVAEKLGLGVWDVLFEKEGPDWQLVIIIDKDGPVGIEDCETMSRAVDPLIDELDPTPYSYNLIVSSPGLGRKLKTDRHFERYIGKAVEVKLIRPDDEGQRVFKGILTGFDENFIEIDNNLKIERRSIAIAKAGDDDLEVF
ncbi:MAG: ribosome maturation factor RimP [Ruminococcaceae bacterium]|nr:ribosome maturation factor RimP [Oscillospiraceae bacterium]